MDGDEFIRLRTILVDRRDQLLREGDISIDPNREDPAAKADEDAQPLNEMEQVIASRRNKKRVEELRHIDAALARMDADPDSFGECEDCEEPIPIRRLELMPWVRTCVLCQSKRQGGYRTTRRRHAADYLE